MDEARLSNDDRSAAWIKFEYFNIANDDHELTWGNDEGKNLYSRGTDVSLKTDDSDETTNFVTQDYIDVAIIDEVRVLQLSEANNYSVFVWKNKFDYNTSLGFTCNLRSDRACSSSTIYLQIYNRNSSTWETLDSDSTTAANVDFNLTGSLTSNLSNYFDVNGWICCRVYQRAI
jgi:hypothetical protein